MSSKLCRLVQDDESYATGIYGLLDLESRSVTLCSAGSPPFFMIRGESHWEAVKLPWLPLRLLDTSTYGDQSIELREDDRLLFFTDDDLTFLGIHFTG
jgi:sigma-B regulation protein RsbU (phosphoserine phosphatase)